MAGDASYQRFDIIQINIIGMKGHQRAIIGDNQYLSVLLLAILERFSVRPQRREQIGSFGAGVSIGAVTVLLASSRGACSKIAESKEGAVCCVSIEFWFPSSAFAFR